VPPDPRTKLADSWVELTSTLRKPNVPLEFDPMDVWKNGPWGNSGCSWLSERPPVPTVASTVPLPAVYADAPASATQSALKLAVGIAVQLVLSASCLVRAYPWSCACRYRSTFLAKSRFMMSVPLAHGKLTSDRQYMCIPTTTHGMPAVRAPSIADAVQL
jgi:hypothetical protein